MKKTVLLSLCLIFRCTTAQAQRRRHPVPPKIQKSFTAHGDAILNRPVLYRKAFTHPDSEGAPALVMIGYFLKPKNAIS